MTKYLIIILKKKRFDYIPGFWWRECIRITMILKSFTMFYDAAISVLCKQDVVILFDVVICSKQETAWKNQSRLYIEKFKKDMWWSWEKIANEAELFLNNYNSNFIVMVQIISSFIIIYNKLSHPNTLSHPYDFEWLIFKCSVDHPLSTIVSQENANKKCDNSSFPIDWRRYIILMTSDRRLVDRNASERFRKWTGHSENI